MSARGQAFWESKSLDELSREEWESLCDGCGRCCLHKFEDEETGDLHFTDVACRFLKVASKSCDPQAAQSVSCREYHQRFRLVDDCMDLYNMERSQLRWMPSTCAYRRLYEDKPLPSWHPLLTGSPAAMIDQGISVATQSIVSEEHIHSDEIEERIIHWIA